MQQTKYYNINNKSEQVNFETALLNGMGSNHGLYTIGQKDIPHISKALLKEMEQMSYEDIAYTVLHPFLGAEISENQLKDILHDAYPKDIIFPELQHATGQTHIMWLSTGPTYSFKDYASRFFARVLNHFLKERKLKQLVVVATSGDTGGAVADALSGLDNIDSVIFFPNGAVSDGQRRQMTTLGGNIHAFSVNGDFDVCQELIKNLLADKDFAKEVFGNKDYLTSANSISLGRLLPQMVYPFFAYSRLARAGQEIIMSIPCGNFGNMMSTTIARQMGLPITQVICGVNENAEFPRFLKTGNYKVKPTAKSPSSAMNVSHPSNLARLIDFYGGHIYDKIDPKTNQQLERAIIDHMPDLDTMRNDIFSTSVDNAQHYKTMKEVFEKHNILLDPHGAVAWRALEVFLKGNHDKLSVVYETADPGKFPSEVMDATGQAPKIPVRIQEQAKQKERIYSITEEPEYTKEGLKLSNKQVAEAKAKIKEIFSSSVSSF